MQLGGNLRSGSRAANRGIIKSIAECAVHYAASRRVLRHVSDRKLISRPALSRCLLMYFSPRHGGVLVTRFMSINGTGDTVDQACKFTKAANVA